VNIEPGYVARGGEPGNYEWWLEIEYSPTNARPQ
jgi:hypothetical protein